MDALTHLRSAFAPVPGYLDAATCGLPARATVDAMRDALDTWQAGDADLAVYDEAVAASRAAFARLVGVDPSWVAIGSQTSALVGLVASSVPDGAEVLVVDGDFASVVFPFLAHADRGVTVRQVPLADEVRTSTHTVAFSLVQSRDGRIADVDAIRTAAAAAGAVTVCDVTQAAGWLPVDATAFDVTVCASYKWLSAPRGTAFLTVRPDVLDRLRPTSAGWYAGEDIWSSVYGPHMVLATDARRLDVSPAWLCWVGAVPALELFADAPADDVHRYAVGLADAFRAGLRLEPGGSAIVALPDDAAGSRRARLAAQGVRAAGRGGGVRLAFHVWNDADDVARAVAALSNS
ncbi:aminotransferase class V-fold PLP-dependent enzyme [Cellulomonas humilata]|nr:aminotransferase class V-fold PLP-dependent enzyme [Cellulomonas humilata]